MAEDEYWEQIVHACFLDEQDPIARWREVAARQEQTRARLDALQIERLHVEGEDADLWITSASSAAGSGGAAATSRASRSSRAPTGAARRDGSTATSRSTATGTSCGASASTFADGRVTEASAEQNERVLIEMIATEGADRLGEFSLTDRRFSRITRFMAQTLYDENTGGEFGNTHIALGRSYQDAYDGDPSEVTERAVAAARLQRLERAHGCRLHERSRGHGSAAGRRRARHLPRWGVPTRLDRDAR